MPSYLRNKAAYRENKGRFNDGDLMVISLGYHTSKVGLKDKYIVKIYIRGEQPRGNKVGASRQDHDNGEKNGMEGENE